MWRWGTPQNFLLAFIGKLWKKPQKIRISKKWKKNCWRYHHFTLVYQKPQSYEVQSWNTELDRIVCHFGSFFALLPPPNNPENQTFEKMKKASGGVIILNLHNEKHGHMIYAYADKVCDRQFFVILGHFLLFYPTIDPGN